MPAPFKTSGTVQVGSAFAYLPAGSYDLTAIPGKPKRCARAVIAMSAQTWSTISGSDGVAELPGAVPQSWAHYGDTSAVQTTGMIAVFW